MAINTSNISIASSTAEYQNSVKPVKTAEPGVTKMNVATPEQPVARKEAPASQYEGEQENGQQSNSEREERQIKNAVEHANSSVKKMQRTACEFTYHEETKRVSIKVMDSDTKEVIREIPSEETLELIAKLWDLSGMLVDEKR